MELTIPTYQGTTQVNPDLGAAISKSKESETFKAIDSLTKQKSALESDMLSIDVKNKEEADRQLKALQLANAKKLQDHQEFADKAKGRIESQELDASIGNMSNTDKASMLDQKIKEVTQAAIDGKISQSYAESFNSSLYEKYGKYADDALKDHNREVVNVNSDIYANLSDADKAKQIESLKASGVSKDVIEGITIGGSVKQLLKETSGKDTMTASEAEAIKAFTLDIKNKIAETGKDPESTPQIKSWLFQLDNLTKDLEDRTTKGAQLQLMKDIGNKGSLSSAYMVDKKLEDFQAVYSKDPAKAYTEFEKFQADKEKMDKARDMAINPNNYTPSEKDAMYKENKAYKAYVAPAITKSYTDAMLNNDFSGANMITLNNPSVIKEEIGKSLTSVLNGLVNVSKDAPEVVASKQEALKQQVNIFEAQMMASQGVAATKALYGDNYETMKNVSNIASYLTGGDVLKAFDMNNQVQSKGLNKILSNELQKVIYKKLENEPARDEIWHSLYVLNTVGSSALNEKTVTSVIDKYHAGDIHTNKGEDDNVVIRSNGHPIDEAIAPQINNYIKETYPEAKSVIQKGSYFEVRSETGLVSTIPVEVWKQNEAIWKKDILDISKMKGQTQLAKTEKFATTAITKAYENVSKNADIQIITAGVKGVSSFFTDTIPNALLESRAQLYIDASKDTSLSSTMRENMLLEAKKIKDKIYINSL